MCIKTYFKRHLVFKCITSPKKPSIVIKLRNPDNTGTPSGHSREKSFIFKVPPLPFFIEYPDVQISAYD